MRYKPLLILLAIGCLIGCQQQTVKTVDKDATVKAVASKTKTSKTVASPQPSDVEQEQEPEAEAKPESKQETLKSKLAEAKEPQKAQAKQEVVAPKLDPEIEKIVAAYKAQQKAEADKLAYAADFKELQAGFAQARQKWGQAFSAAKTNEERTKIRAENPAAEYGAKFLALREKYSDVSASIASLSSAMQYGDTQTKEKAVTMLLENAADPTDKIVNSALMMAATYGSDEQKAAAIDKILEPVSKDPKSPESVQTLMLLSSRRMSGENATKVANALKVGIMADLRSNQSANALEALSKVGDEASRKEAVDLLIEHHMDSGAMKRLLNGRATPSASREYLLKEVIKNSTGAAKARGLVALAKYISQRNMYADFYASADEEAKKNLDPAMLEYLMREVDPDESVQLEKDLDTFVSDFKSVMEEAEGELFVMKNLSVGKTAPDIVGSDLDGVEFKLSDYRGKVVFLDFWGDW